jgi:TatD DNase family protein
MAMIDSHVHLNHPDFRDDLEDVVARARWAGVTMMMNIGFDLESSRETVSLAERFPSIRGAVGVHPHDAKTYTDDVETELSGMLDNPGIIAVGEIGLDYYRDLSPRDVQKTVFKRQLALAEEKGKPLVIHCRDAFDDVMGILAGQAPRFHGIFHAFSGDAAMAADVLSLGFHIGVGGVVTFKNARLREVVSELPVGAIVLETDCPYLAPVPFRGKRNEPAYLRYVLETVSAATGRPAEKIVEATSENFARAMRITV